MRILFLISTLGLGGAEKQLVAWAGLLKHRLGAEVSVASFAATANERLSAFEELAVPVVLAGRDVSTFRRIERVMSFARTQRVEVVHSFSWRLSPIALATAKVARAVAASSFQGDGFADLALLSPVQRSLTLHTIRYYTSNSRDAIANVLPSIHPDAMLMYVPNLVTQPDPVHLEHRRSRGTHDPTVLAVARLDENKRLNVFLEALAIARTQEPRLTGVIVGDGPARDQLLGLATRLGLLPGGVSFVGPVLEPGKYYADADIFAHFAASEGTPNVVLEAMAMGVPVVTTPAGDLRNIIEHDRNGLLVPFDDCTTAAGHLVDLVRDPVRGATIGTQGRAHVLASYDDRTVERALGRFYAAVLSSKGRASRMV